jgi:hypothetical protein
MRERAGEGPAWCSTLAAVAKLGKAELNAMTAGAIVDAHGEDEQISGSGRHWAR